MKKCAHEKSKCVDSRPFAGYRRRRYECVSCKWRWSTVEVKKPEHLNIGVLTQIDIFLQCDERQIAAINNLILNFQPRED